MKLHARDEAVKKDATKWRNQLGGKNGLSHSHMYDCCGSHMCGDVNTPLITKIS